MLSALRCCSSTARPASSQDIDGIVLEPVAMASLNAPSIRRFLQSPTEPVAELYGVITDRFRRTRLELHLVRTRTAA